MIVEFNIKCVYELRHHHGKLETEKGEVRLLNARCDDTRFSPHLGKLLFHANNTGKTINQSTALLI